MSKLRIADVLSNFSATLFTVPQFHEPSSSAQNIHITTDGYPDLVYEVSEVLNLTRWSLLELETMESKRVTLKAIPTFSPLYTELSGVHPALYSDLSSESHRVVRQEALDRRQLEVTNRLVCIKRDKQLFIFHFVGEIGHKLCCTTAMLNDLGNEVNWNIDHLAVSEINGFQQNQIMLSREALDSLICTRSTHHISLFSFSWKSPYELFLRGSYFHKGERIIDMRFCPYSYPEMIFSCKDGSLYSVDLEALLMNPVSRANLVAEEILPPDGGEYRAICEYGTSPRHLLLALDQKLFSIHLAFGVKKDLVLSFNGDEKVLAMQSTMSNNGSEIKDPFLLAILTNHRLQVNDLRTVPEVLFSWDIQREISSPNTLSFFLEDAPIFLAHQDLGTRIGRLVYGEFCTGDFHEIDFTLSRPRVSLDAPDEEDFAMSEISLRGKEEGDYKQKGLPVITTQERKHMEFSFQFCCGLAYFNDGFHSKTVYIPSFLDRLRSAYPASFPHKTRLLPSRELTQWKDFLKRSPDTLGFAFVPYSECQTRGILVRMNPVGDLVIHRVCPSNDPSLLERNRQLKKEDDYRLEKLKEKWKVARQRSQDFDEENEYWLGCKECLDLDLFDLNCYPREMVVNFQQKESILTRLRMNLPIYLKSSRLGIDGKLTYSSIGGSVDSGYPPPLPLTLHNLHFQRRLAHDKNEEMLSLQDEELRQLMDCKETTSLWRLHQEALHFHFQKPKEKNCERKTGIDGVEKLGFHSRVPIKRDGNSCIAKDLLLKKNTAILEKPARLDFKERIRSQLESSSECRSVCHQKKIIPSVYSTVKNDFVCENRRWQAELANEDLLGSDVVYIPVETSQESNIEEVHMVFKEAKYQTIIPMSSPTEGEECKLLDMEQSWKTEWRRLCSKK